MGLLRTDLFRLTRLSLAWWLMIVLLVLVLIRGLVLPPDPELPWVGLWSVGLVTPAIIMLTAVFVGQEFSEGIFRSLVSRGVPRWLILLCKFVTLALVGVGALLLIEGLATLLGVRSELRWGELTRAWLGLMPYISLTLLLVVLARNGGLPLVVGVIWFGAENLFAMVMGGLAMIAELPGWDFLTHRGLAGALFRWSPSYNAANWTYLANWQRAPVPLNVLLMSMPRTAWYSALVLTALTVLGVGLAILVVRRQAIEVVASDRRLLAFVGRRARGNGQDPARQRPVSLPSLSGKGPLLTRLVRVHIFKMGRTSLVKIGVVVALLFPLTLWGVSWAGRAAGLGDVLFTPGAMGDIPLAFVVSLLMVGPLAAVISILAVSNELTLDTRRAELTRGVTRLQTIVAQSLALVLTLGAVFAFLMLVTVLIGVNVSGSWSLGGAVLVTLVSALAASAYVTATQVGGALTGSPLGAMLFGLGFLLSDWLAILTPTVLLGDVGILSDLARYTVASNAFALAGKSQIVGLDAGWEYLSAPLAVVLLLAYAIVGTLLAALFANRRDV